ncbi:MAG TPA: NfeD family protein, partial [Acidimicrobiales bacterium]|nr:NfeD family protein [Acidimicrobiales bacterium]
AGVLLGLVVLGTLVGFHAGPHAHLAAGVIGVMAAAALLVLAAQGRSTTLLWALLALDATASAALGFLAWRGLSQREVPGAGSRLLIEAGSEGTAVTDLDPEGIVRVHGEAWSAQAINGPVRAGSPVYVIGRVGVRLSVWGEESAPLGEVGAAGPWKEDP